MPWGFDGELENGRRAGATNRSCQSAAIKTATIRSGILVQIPSNAPGHLTDQGIDEIAPAFGGDTCPGR